MKRIKVVLFALLLCNLVGLSLHAQQTEIISCFQCELYDGEVPYCYVRPIENFDYGRVVIPETIEFQGVNYKVVIVSGFNDLPGLTDIDIPACVTGIYNTFNNCPNIARFTLKEGSESLDIYGSFNGVNIPTLYIPTNISHITESFNNCNTETLTIGVLPAEPNYNQVYGALIESSFEGNNIDGLIVNRPIIITNEDFLSSMQTLYMYDQITARTESGVPELPALYYAQIGGKATVPERFFTKSPRLNNVVISLENIEGKNDWNRVHIDKAAFDGCNLSSVIIRFDGIDDINNSEARGQLYYSNLEVLGDDGNTTELRSPFYNSGVNYVEINGYVDMIDGFRSVECGLFESIETLETVSVCGIVPTRVFRKCPNLKNAMLSKVTDLQDGAFESCTALERVYLPALSNDLDDDVFSDCTSLKHLFALSNWGGSLSGLNGCSSLVDLETMNMKYIRNLSNCTSLVELTFEAAETIYSEAFLNCSSLKKITFGPKLSYIGDNIFSGCTSLTDIYIAATEPPSCDSLGLPGLSTNAHALANGTQTTGVKLHVPAEAVEAYREADVWKDFDVIEAWDPNSNSIPEQQFTGVDLGLSVIWAETNVGTCDSEFPGNYFSASSVATINENSGWRLPTKEEFEELLASQKWYNTFDFTCVHYVNEDVTLDLPIGGCFWSTSIKDVSEAGYYWVASEDFKSYAVLKLVDYELTSEVTDLSTPTKMSLRLVRSREGSVEDIASDEQDANPQYYNLQGIRVNNPVKGQIYIKLSGGKGSKVKF